MLEQGSRAPAFMLRDAGGVLRGRIDALEKGPLLIAFYKSACPTCQLAMPKLQRLHEAYGDQVTVWGISQDDVETTEAFARTHGATFPQLLDEAEDGFHISRLYGIVHVPTAFLIDREGLIVRARAGWDRDAWNELATTMAALIEREPVLPSTADDGLPAFQPGCAAANVSPF